MKNNKSKTKARAAEQSEAHLRGFGGKRRKMKVNNYVRIIAGSLVFLSSLLGYFHNHNWLWITMFVGLNLFQYGFTGFCPLVKVLKKLGVKE